MNTYIKCATAVMLALSAAACNDFLTGGELSNNPNLATSATAQNLFVGTQVGLWAELGSDMSRVTMIWAQHLTGNNQQYVDDNNYNITEQTTNGFQQALYIRGGLVDMRNLEASARTSHDSLFLGIAQVQEAWMMGEGADLFGDLVYSMALTGQANPPLDKQMVVYAHVEALLDTAILNIAAPSGINVGPQGTDLAYNGNAGKWGRLAHTLKARFYMHQIHAPGVDAAAQSALALAQAQLGLQDGDDYNAVWSGNVLQQNFWYQFNTFGNAGDYIGSQTLIDTLTARHDTLTLLASYFNQQVTIDTVQGVPDTVVTYPNLASARLQPNTPQTFASHVENLLLLAEAAYRTGNQGMALVQLEAARTAEGVVDPTYSIAVNSGGHGPPPAGQQLLHAILDEKWIADFQLGTEAWTDYRRTCTPNLAPTVAGKKIPGRLFYDQGERQTNTNIPNPGVGINGFYNQAQPPLATSDGNSLACLAQ